ncbi:MAG: glutamate synthase subunit beta [Nocardioidaceae bacterium]
MADPRGFLTTPREVAVRRPVDERVADWREVYPEDAGLVLLPIIGRQAGRCMDCGIPFCHEGCPLGNLIPEWNDLVYRDDWQAAADRLHATNNFPEFTGRLCPAPCESSCVLSINDEPVTIKNVEVSIADTAWDRGFVQPHAIDWLTGRTVAVVGSGPAGLGVAQQLTRVGHTVVVYERAAELGGLLRFGIPEFKMEKRHVDRRLEQMRAEGTVFRSGISVGTDVTGAELTQRFDAVVLATGSTVSRDLLIPGRSHAGVHQAMEYLPQANRVAGGGRVDGQIVATGKHVVVIGGGDTGADCVGTAHRQGAASVTQLEILPRPAELRGDLHPWPTYPMIYRVSSAHEEGGERVYAVSTLEFLGNGTGEVRALRLAEVAMTDGRFEPAPGSERELPAELVLLALGFTGPETHGVVAELGLALDGRGNVARDAAYMTSSPGVFVAGDAGRGQSLVVWAIAEGRSAAAAVDRYLTGVSTLPAPITPDARPLLV